MLSTDQIAADVRAGNFRTLARTLTVVENELAGSEDFLRSLPHSQTPIIGITGPPGAGKSTLVNTLISALSAEGKRIAVIAVDPTSPFNFGSLLGDRIRMSEHFNKPNVFIRSLATRGSLGGLSAKTIEMTDILKSVGFDYILVETVGVGQSEVEIAGLADISIVVLVPESGDDIQNIKSGLMEIADIFVINKADREGSSSFANNLEKILKQKAEPVLIVKTIAINSTGTDVLLAAIQTVSKSHHSKREFLLTEKAWKLIREHKMKSVDKNVLSKEIKELSAKGDFNLYQYIQKYLDKY